ncbi:MAG: transporter substrate-binding domain-containing protein [Desulfobacter sp.]|nr:MAG: transporter substrate-binding domain-containing protein [Desulfobacter sp.]
MPLYHSSFLLQVAEKKITNAYFKGIGLCLCFLLMVLSMGECATLKVICDEWPPYQILENGHVTGFSTEVVKMVFDEMKIDIGTISAYPWKRAMVMLEKSRADALFSANFTMERTAFAFYAKEPIICSSWVVWGRKQDHLKFNSFDDFMGKRIGVVRGYSYTPEFWSFVKKHGLYHEVVNDEMNFRKLNAGRVDFIVAELGNGRYISRTLGLDDKIIPFLSPPIKTDCLFIIFNKARVNRTLVDKFSAELKKVKQGSLYKYLHYLNLGFWPAGKD